MREGCEQYGLLYDKNDTKAILWGYLRKCIADNVRPVIVTIAEDCGHEVVYSPPHHSDLQSIELIWSIVKGCIGQQYTTNTKFSDILVRLKRAFHQLHSREVQGCINKANLFLKQLWKNIQAIKCLNDESSDEEKEHDNSNNLESNSDLDLH